METERILTTAEQARAVQEVGFLGQFFTPTSPSDVAKKLSMPANLAHHHAQRHLGLGLLEETGREGGKVLYQLTARLFKVPRTLLPPESPDNKTARLLDLIQTRFLTAYARSSRLEDQDDPDYDLYGFVAKDDPDAELPETSGGPLEPRPAHFQARTFSLSSASYQKLVREINELVVAAENEPEKPGSGLCTLVFWEWTAIYRQGRATVALSRASYRLPRLYDILAYDISAYGISARCSSAPRKTATALSSSANSTCSSGVWSSAESPGP